MNTEKSAEHTCGFLIAVIAGFAMLMAGFGAQAFAASHFGLTGPDAARHGASGLPLPGSDGTGTAAGLEVAAHPASAEQPAANPPSEIGPIAPSSNKSGTESSIWMTMDRILLILVFLAGIVLVGILAVRMIRKKRKPDAR
jgi:hypothetical protein